MQVDEGNSSIRPPRRSIHRQPFFVMIARLAIFGLTWLDLTGKRPAVVGAFTTNSLVVAQRPAQLTSGAPPVSPALRPTMAVGAQAGRDNGDEEDEEEESNDKEELPLGMEEAFRKLDSLRSLDEASERPDKASSASSKTSLSTTSLPLEKEIEVYKSMVGDSDRTDDIYSDILSDMKDPASADKSSENGGSLMDDPAMQQALQEAMKEASVKNPATKNALDDREIMKEIEAIMERGNAELLASLEEIRQEQRAYAASKAADSAQKAMDEYEAGQQARLAAAEKAVQTWLQRVKTEQAAVQQAVDDLAAAQKEMDGGAISKLRDGGLPKQMALVGLVLFSVRSIVDTIASLTEPGLISGALLQGAIALACAAYLFLI